MFKIADRYVLRQIGKPILTAIIIGLLVLMAERLVRLLDVTLGKRSSIAVIFELLAYLVPHYLGMALPLALFIGLLIGFNKLSKDSELDAFQASGISLARLNRPVMVLSAGIMMLSFVIFGLLQPYSRYAYRAIMFAISNVQVFYLAEEGVFMQAGSRTFILDKLSRENSEFRKIFIFDYKGKDGSETITAAGGRLIEVSPTDRPVLRLENGHRLRITAWPDAASPPPPPAVGQFTRADTPLGRAGSTPFRARGGDEREMTMRELWAQLSLPESDQNYWDTRAELHRRLIMVVSPLLLPILALPFAIHRRRSRRAYRFGIAVVLLVAYHEVIEKGAVVVRVQHASPWTSLWLPFAVLGVFAIWRYVHLCYGMPGDGLDRIFDTIADGVTRLRERLLRPFRRSPA